MQQNLNTKYVIVTMVIFISLFVNLGTQPLFLEEPRRALITQEMRENKNWLIPTQLGEYYYKKPPGYNWALGVSTAVFGDQHEWAWRLPTVLSVIGIAIVLFGMGRIYLGEEQAWLSALFFVVAGGPYFYFSLLAEIDLYYSLITIIGLLGFYHFDRQERLNLAFSILYLSGALGFLTKGFPSIVFIGATLLTLVIYQKRWSLLWCRSHFLGMIWFGLIVGGYVFVYDREGHLANLMAVLWGESSQRTVVENGALQLASHMVSFPMQSLIDMLPGSLFLGLVCFRSVRNNLWKNHFLRWCFWVGITNYGIYLLAPGARQRYVYMLYPFFLFWGAAAFVVSKSLLLAVHRYFNVFVQGLLVVIMLVSLAIPFIPPLQFLSPIYLWGISMVSAICFGVLIWLRKTNRLPGALSLLLALGIVRLIFDAVVLPQRANESEAQLAKETATQIHQLVNHDELYVWQDSRFSFTTVFYLNQLRSQTLRKVHEEVPGAWYLAEIGLIQSSYEVFHTFDYQGKSFGLVKFQNNQ